MAKFSYAQLVELYNEKVKQSRPINIKQCSEILNIRRDLLSQHNNLHTNLKNLLVEQRKFKRKRKSYSKC